MDVQFHCVIEKASVEEEKIFFFLYKRLTDAVLVPISQGTEVTIVTKYVSVAHENVSEMSVYLTNIAFYSLSPHVALSLVEYCPL